MAKRETAEGSPPQDRTTRPFDGRGAEALAAELEGAISTGRFPVGSKLPTETQLCRQFSASRYAVRQALSLLTSKGRLRTIRRIGWFVAPERIQVHISARSSTVAEFERAGLDIAHHLIAHRTCVPPVQVSRHLRLARRSEVIELEQQTLANGAPFSHVTTWLPAERFARITRLIDANTTVKAALQKLGIGAPRRHTLDIHSRTASRKEARFLSIPANAQVLVLDCVSVDISGEPTHLTRCIVDAVKFDLHIEL